MQGRLVRSLVLGTSGLVLVVGGFAADAVAHSTDVHLADHEGPLTLSNPSHLCVFLGLVLLAGGLGLGWIEAMGTAPARVSRRAVGAALAVSLLVSGGLGGAAVADARRSATAHEVSLDPAVCGRSHARDLGPVAAGSRLPRDADAALAALAGGAPVDLGDGAGFAHQHGATGPATVLPGDQQALLDAQLACATAAAEQLRTPEQATAAGYVQGTTRTVGLGTHWIDWTAVGQPFDPAHPAMLLFDERRPGRPPELVGFSYWVGSDADPAGFAGPDDRWHRHVGMCFVDGWLAVQSVAAPEACEGAFLAGTNLWMLHAWVVDGVPNRNGLFADLNPSLCATPRNTPDFLRCDPTRL